MFKKIMMVMLFSVLSLHGSIELNTPEPNLTREELIEKYHEFQDLKRRLGIGSGIEYRNKIAFSIGCLYPDCYVDELKIFLQTIDANYPAEIDCRELVKQWYEYKKKNENREGFELQFTKRIATLEQQNLELNEENKKLNAESQPSASNNKISNTCTCVIS